MAFVFVTNDIDPYFRDIIGVMAQHYGCTYRFRYERRKDFDLIGSIPAGILKGAAGVVALRNWSTGRLYPIRKIHIEDVFVSERFIVPRFTLLDFPAPSSVVAKWPAVEARICSVAKQSRGNGQLEPLIYEITDAELDECVGSQALGEDDFNRWIAVTDSISGCNQMGQCVFLYLHTIRDERGRVVTRDEIRREFIPLDAETVYTLEVASYMLPRNALFVRDQDRVEPFSLKLQTDENLVSAIKTEDSVVSRYDQHLFIIRDKSPAGGTTSQLRISGEAPGLFLPIITVPVHIGYTVWQWVAVLLGSTLLLLSSLVPDQHAVWQKLMQAIGLLLVAAVGKEFFGSVTKRLWNSKPLSQLSAAMSKMRGSGR